MLSTDEEAELAEHLRKMAEIGFPCDQADARKLAYEFAQKKRDFRFFCKKEVSRLLLVHWIPSTTS